jgi:hypothetical protein
MEEWEQQRQARHRLAVQRHAEKVTGNIAATCRYYGIIRQCFYEWQRRHDSSARPASVTAPACRCAPEHLCRSE